MKRILTLFVLLMVMTCCAQAQSELPKLHLSEIKDKDKIVYNTEWYTEYESGSWEDDTHLTAKYNYYGELELYSYVFDCGCCISFYSNGMTYEHEECPEGIKHAAPVVHPYRVELLDDDVIVALNKLTGGHYTYDDVKTPVPYSGVETSDGIAFTLPDMGYDDVIMYNDRVDEYQPFDAELVSGVWRLKFPWKTEIKDVRVCVKKGEKLSYYKNNGLVNNAIHTVFQYFPDDQYWLDGGYRYNTNGEYNADGKMERYAYERYEDGYEGFVRYNMRNELCSFAYNMANGDHWFYTPEDGWEYWAYSDDQYRKAVPPESVVSAVLPPIEMQRYTVSAATSTAEMKNTTVPFVLVDEKTKAALDRAGVGLDVAAYPPQGNLICYEIAWSDADAWQIIGADGVDLVIPWPQGFDPAWAMRYAFTIEHEVAPGRVETFSTVDGTAQPNEAGLLCHVNKFSPFVMNWGTEAEMQQIVNSHEKGMDALPSTGDDSALIMWIVLLALCMLAVTRNAWKESR